jgi:hypothetical protein
MPRIWSLTAIAIASGIAMLLAFSRFSNQDRIRLAKRKIRAHLYEFRLFADEPALMFRAQKQLLVWNARYIGLMLRPTAVILLPMLALLVHLDAVYGHRALRAGERTIVDAEIVGVDLREVEPTLAGAGVTVETAGVRIPKEHGVYWRIQANEGGGYVVLRVAGESLAKNIQAGAGLRYLSERRVASLPAWLRYPAESRLPGGIVRKIQVNYPTADLRIFGIGVHWMVWFFIISSITMLALRRRFRVIF